MRKLNALVAVAALVLVAPSRAQDEEIAWVTDLDAARRSARAEGKPLFLVFR